MDASLSDVAVALSTLDGFEPLACDGVGHPLEGAAACLHVRCSLPSPAREVMLGRVAPLARRAQFVLAALVDRRDLYCLAFRPGKRSPELPAAAAALAALLRDPEALASGTAVDRRGRT